MAGPDASGHHNRAEPDLRHPRYSVKNQKNGAALSPNSATRLPLEGSNPLGKAPKTAQPLPQGQASSEGFARRVALGFAALCCRRSTGGFINTFHASPRSRITLESLLGIQSLDNANVTNSNETRPLRTAGIIAETLGNCAHAPIGRSSNAPHFAADSRLISRHFFGPGRLSAESERRRLGRYTVRRMYAIGSN